MEQARRERHAAIHKGFAQRHPQIAQAERAMRKERAEREKRYTKRDKLQDGGTPETRAKAARVRQGSLARLYEAGHLTIDQLAASQEIRSVAERIARDVSIGSFSLETRVDESRHGGAFFEKLGAVRAEVAYTRWRKELAQSKRGTEPVLAMIVGDEACRSVARRLGMRDTTARKLLSSALDRWADIIGDTCKMIDQADLLAMQAGLV